MIESERRRTQKKQWKERNRKHCACGNTIDYTSKMCCSCAGRMGAKAKRERELDAQLAS